MSSTIDQLKRVFIDSCIPVSQETLEEPQEKMSRSLFLGESFDRSSLLVCRLDPNCLELFPYLKKSELGGLKGMRCICDYVIFVEKGDVLFVLLFELKKGKESPVKQLELSVPFIDFILRRAILLNHIKIHYEIRKIGISDVPERRTTIMRGDLIYDNCFLKLYNGKRIYLERLLH